jgi:uncharacterized protein YcbK (DUF882 family)
MGDLTRDFSRKEFACQCGCGFESISMQLVAGLQELRNKVGLPVTVLSGCRCAAHNKAVGGAAGSRHTMGKAADIQIEGMTAREVYAAAMQAGGFRGFGVDDARGFVHVDERPVVTRWCYRGGRQSAWMDEAPVRAEVTSV